LISGASVRPAVSAWAVRTAAKNIAVNLTDHGNGRIEVICDDPIWSSPLAVMLKIEEGAMQSGQPQRGKVVLLLVLLLTTTLWRAAAAQSAPPEPQTPYILANWDDREAIRVAAVDRTRKDMDKVISTKGVPRQVEDVTLGGAVRRAQVTFYYPDEILVFATDEDRSDYSVLISQTKAQTDIPQQPIPKWIKAKYPDLNWTDIPLK
jgi:hypothetical protein